MEIQNMQFFSGILDFRPLKTSLFFAGRPVELQLPQRQQNILWGQKGQVLPVLVSFQYSISLQLCF